MMSSPIAFGNTASRGLLSASPIRSPAPAIGNADAHALLFIFAAARNTTSRAVGTEQTELLIAN